MCANNLDPQIATYVCIAEPQNFDALMSKASNVERQLARQNTTQPKREEIKRPTKKGKSMATFVRTSLKPTNDENFNKNGKGRKTDDSLSRKERKRSIHSMMMMFKGYLMSWWLEKAFLFQSRNDLPRSIWQMILSITHTIGSLATP